MKLLFTLLVAAILSIGCRPGSKAERRPAPPAAEVASAPSVGTTLSAPQQHLDAEADSFGATFDAAGLKREQAIEFFQRVKQLVSSHDPAVVRLVALPISVSIAGRESVIRSDAEFRQKYDAIFNRKVLEAIARQNQSELSANGHGVMVGNGEIWFGCPNTGFSRNGAGRLVCEEANMRIIKINN